VFSDAVQLTLPPRTRGSNPAEQNAIFKLNLSGELLKLFWHNRRRLARISRREQYNITSSIGWFAFPWHNRRQQFCMALGHEPVRV
jgi:hypothetical protein